MNGFLGRALAVVVLYLVGLLIGGLVRGQRRDRRERERERVAAFEGRRSRRHATPGHANEAKATMSSSSAGDGAQNADERGTRTMSAVGTMQAASTIQSGGAMRRGGTGKPSDDVPPRRAGIEAQSGTANAQTAHERASRTGSGLLGRIAGWGHERDGSEAQGADRDPGDQIARRRIDPRARIRTLVDTAHQRRERGPLRAGAQGVGRAQQSSLVGRADINRDGAASGRLSGGELSGGEQDRDGMLTGGAGELSGTPDIPSDNAFLAAGGGTDSGSKSSDGTESPSVVAGAGAETSDRLRSEPDGGIEARTDDRSREASAVRSENAHASTRDESSAARHRAAEDAAPDARDLGTAGASGELVRNDEAVGSSGSSLRTAKGALASSNVTRGDKGARDAADRASDRTTRTSGAAEEPERLTARESGTGSGTGSGGVGSEASPTANAVSESGGMSSSGTSSSGTPSSNARSPDTLSPGSDTSSTKGGTKGAKVGKAGNEASGSAAKSPRVKGAARSDGSRKRSTGSALELEGASEPSAAKASSASGGNKGVSGKERGNGGEGGTSRPHPAGATSKSPPVSARTRSGAGGSAGKSTSRDGTAAPAAASSSGNTVGKRAEAKGAKAKGTEAKGAATTEGREKADGRSTPATTGDDLKLIRGIGPKNEQRLKEAGVTTFAQIAAWTEADRREFSERLSFQGRIEREEWVEQAQTLAEGGTTDFSQRASSGRVRSSLALDDPRYKE